tara:strand:- start:4254 stop:5036 length:783 start_codon:yes stop_codon:yes gene_type:complete
MALTNKKVSQSYKDILTVNNSNSGIDGTARKIEDGEGTQSCASLSSNVLQVQPASNSGTTVVIADSAGSSIFLADTNAKLLKAHASQSYVQTNYLRFTGHDIDVVGGYHHLVGIIPTIGTGSTLMPNTVQTLGNSANPTVPTISTNADDIIHYLHYVDINMSVDAVEVLVAGNAAAGDTINFHLVSLATGDSTTIDDFSGITVVADNSDVVTQGYEQFYRMPLSVQSADVDAGNYLALTIESDGTGGDYSVNAQVRYHLR